MSLGRLLVRHVEHVVHRDDADEHAGRVGDRQGRSILARKTRTASPWWSVAFKATNRRSMEYLLESGTGGHARPPLFILNGAVS